MFGIRIVTKKGLERIEQNAKNHAIAELVALLRQKDKIYLEPVTLVGDGQVVRDCVFLCAPLAIKKRRESIGAP